MNRLSWNFLQLSFASLVPTENEVNTKTLGPFMCYARDFSAHVLRILNPVNRSIYDFDNVVIINGCS